MIKYGVEPEVLLTNLLEKVSNQELTMEEAKKEAERLGIDYEWN